MSFFVLIPTVFVGLLATLQSLRAENIEPKTDNFEETHLIRTLTKYANNSDGIPALLYATKVGDFAAVKLLLQYGADPYTRDIHKNSALYFALDSHNYTLVEFFLEQGLDPNDEKGQILWKAIEIADIESFKSLIAYGLKLNSSSYCRSFGASLGCIFFGRWDLLKLVLSEGGDLPRDPMLGLYPANVDPVLWSAFQNHPGKGKEKVDCLCWLIENKILTREDLRFAAQGDLVVNSCPEMLEYLIENDLFETNRMMKSGDYPLQACLSRPDLVSFLIMNGAEVNAKSLDGGTALHRAATVTALNPDYLKSIELLLEHGANVNARDDMGRTPLKRAHDLFVKRLLIAHGAIE